MDSWKQNLQEFFDSNNIQLKKAEFDDFIQSEIQNFNNTSLKKALAIFSKEISLRENLESQIFSTKKNTSSIMENIELRIYKRRALKLIYKPFFIKNENGILVNFKYSLCDVYGEECEYIESGLKDYIQHIDYDDVLNNITEIFIYNNNWK